MNQRNGSRAAPKLAAGSAQWVRRRSAQFRLSPQCRRIFTHGRGGTRSPNSFSTSLPRSGGTIIKTVGHRDTFRRRSIRTESTRSTSMDTDPIRHITVVYDRPAPGYFPRAIEQLVPLRLRSLVGRADRLIARYHVFDVA